MILIDDRTGSGDLLPLMKRLGVPAELDRLDFGDLAFVGQGPDGLPWQVGLEVKTISDVMQCMHSGRFAAHQLPGMLQRYDDCWLLVEGEWRPSATDGVLQVRHPHKGYWYDFRTGGRHWMWRDVQGWLQTMMVLGGLRVWTSPDRASLARTAAGIYHWWCDKPFAEHKSLKTFQDYKARVGTSMPNGKVMLRTPTFARRIYKELPNVGWERSDAVERKFPTVLDAMLASETDWQAIPGVGKVTAKKIIDALTTRSSR